MADLTASDGSDGDRFGVSVAVGGDTIVVSAKNHGVDSVDHGAVYVFSEPSSGWTDANETAKLTPSDGADHDRFGAKVALVGDTVVVGAPHDDDGEGNRSVGSAYVFIKPDSGWSNSTETSKLTASDGDEYHQFGSRWPRTEQRSWWERPSRSRMITLRERLTYSSNRAMAGQTPPRPPSFPLPTGTTSTFSASQ